MTAENDAPAYNVAVPCRVCGAGIGSPCVRYTDEFPDAPKGTLTPWPHRFGGRVIPPVVTDGGVEA